MYPPPQGDVVIDSHSRPVSGEHAAKFGFDYIRSQMKQHSNPPPFSYEYVLEDGKMPTLAEFHAVESKNAAGVLRSSSTRSASHSRVQRRPVPVNRSSSYNKTEKQPLNLESHATHESATDKLKRAFSLSSGKTSAVPSRQPSTASRRERTSIVVNTQPSRNVSQSSRHHIAPFTAYNANTRHSSPPSESRVPSLVLPTPTPSPKLMHSASSSPQKPPMNFGLPNHHVYGSERPFSWAYNDDVMDDNENDDDDFDDIAFLQQSGMGRLYPNYKPAKQFRKAKAFELLGIANKGKNLHHTASTSTTTSHRPSPASSDRDHLSRESSRRISRDYQYGGWNQSAHADCAGSHANRMSTPKGSPSASSMDEDTPRPPKHLRQQQAPRKAVSSPISRPIFVVKNPAPGARPKPILVPEFPIPPTTESRSAPANLSFKPESPLHSTTRGPLVLAEPQPLPVTVAKVSRFIEHLDTNAKRLSLSITPAPVSPRPAFLETRSLSDPDMIAPAPRRATSPMPVTLRNPPSPRIPHVVISPQVKAFNFAHNRPAVERELSASGVRRSVSMRESSSGPWGAVVCTAQARPIVAKGHAKVVE